MYEKLSFVAYIFTDLAFRVELSPRSNKQIYEQGLETIPSDTVCYPAKMAHGHIQALIDATIFILVLFLNSKKQWKQIIILIVQLCKATQMLFEIMWMPSERAKWIIEIPILI